MSIDKPLTEIMERFDNAGPIPRICFEYIDTDITRSYTERNMSIVLDTTQRLVTRLLDREASGLFAVLPQEPISAVVRHKLLYQLRQWKHQHRIKMIEQFSRIPGAAGIKSLLFESLPEQVCHSHRN
ncbi:hypothetical protein AMATHDRAFT_60559 [Amanita thiersii Skay4041]|uniref:Uncharacterized protein n=1 Tax=Amanita thiersii Skay4041 TaxID=703135 RepID=A0A2A9NSU8_9AGAR|nr:hypothetical protein AMATHDRAFT_60559 [Amanita thiersii Skay4041]